MVKDKCIELALKDTWFNPSYCCCIVANLLHTCNPPETGTLPYSVLFFHALPGRERLVCVCACVCVLYEPCNVCVGGRQNNSLHQRQLAKCMAVWVPSRGHRANLVVIC